MRIAIAGKGGSGKTTLAGTLARLLARRGQQVIALDGDTNPNLAQALGIAAGTELVALPGDILVRREDPNADPPSELSMPVHEVLERYGTVGPDGVRLLVMGHVEHAGRGCKCRAHSVARYVIGDLLAYANGEGAVVVDMEAGLEHLSRGTTRYVDALLAVAEPYYRSMETARRVYELAAELGIDDVRLVANKVRDPADSDALRAYAERHGLAIAGEIPFDELVLEADRRAEPLLDVAGADAPAVRAMERLASTLLANGR
ncbi:MAG: AAA family ATPase [Gemmatimonadales bacterium]|nr:AAA family ATPase [Gemmatimonadales bacterium]